EPIERRDHVARVLEPFRRVLLEAAGEEARQRGREPLERRGDVKHPGDALRGREAVASRGAAHEPVEGRAEREDGGSTIDRQLAHLLGREVPGGTEYGTGDRQLGRVLALHRLEQLGQAEVEDLQVTARGDEDVLWFEIAVDDAFGVRSGQAAGDLLP